MPATYLDSSALVKLVIEEPETAALNRFLQRRHPLVSSSLARTEVIRAVLPKGADAIRRGSLVLSIVELVRISDRILDAAAVLVPESIRSLDAVHLATARELGPDLGEMVSYDRRMAEAAGQLGMTSISPT